MDKKILLKGILSRKHIPNYVYPTIFFMISTVFAFFAIKPSISIAITLRKEADELRVVNQQYEQNISQIIRLQSELETIRDKTYLLTQALPPKPSPRTIIDNIRKVESTASATFKDISLPTLELKNATESAQKELKPISLDLSTPIDYERLNRMISAFGALRRLTSIKQVNIEKQSASSENTSELELGVSVDMYYL